MGEIKFDGPRVLTRDGAFVVMDGDRIILWDGSPARLIEPDGTPHDVWKAGCKALDQA